MSEAKYEVFRWLQELADNLLHVKATHCTDLILKKSDDLAVEYVQARKLRFKALIRQYIGSITFQVIMHTGLLGTAGWLLSQGELTLGQLVAAEVVIAGILLKFESVVKRTYLVFYIFTSFEELDQLFSLPQDRTVQSPGLLIPKNGEKGLHVSCSNLSWASDRESTLAEIRFEARPGEKWALICPTESSRTRLSLVLAGLEQPPEGTIKCNGVDIRSVSADQIAHERGIFFGRGLTLFGTTILDNITMGRPKISSEDLLWSMRLSELDKEIETLPSGLETMVVDGGKDLTSSLRLRILLARTIISRPPLIILDGAMHELPRHIREPIILRLSSMENPWTLILVTADPKAKTYTQNFLSIADTVPQ